MCRRIAIALGLLIILAVGGVTWLATRRGPLTPATPVVSARPASPEQVRAAEDRIRSSLKPVPAPAPMPTQPAAFAKPDPAGAPPPPTASNASSNVTVRLAQDDLNTLLANDPHLREKMLKAGVGSIQIALSAPDHIAAVAQVDYQGHTADVTAQGTLSVTDAGGLAFLPQSMAVGLLPLPQSVADKFQGQVDAALQHVQEALPLRVRQIHVENQVLVLTGPAKDT